MAPHLQILNNVVERLKNVDVASCGHLYGLISDNLLTVLTFTLNIPDDAQTAPFELPTEVDCCGIIQIGECSQDILDAFKEIDITDNPLLIKCATHGSSLESHFYIHEKLEPVSDIEIITEEDVLQRFVYIGLQGSITVDMHNLNIMDVLEETRTKINAGNMGIYFSSKGTYLLNEEKSCKGVLLKDLLNNIDKCEKQTNNENVANSNMDVIPASIFFKISENKSTENSIKYAPVLQQIRRPFNGVQYNLHISTLSLVSRTVKSENLYATLVESVSRCIKLLERYFVKVELNESNISTSTPKLIHFKPRTCGHLITVVYPTNYTDMETAECRRNLHKVLALGMTKPMFRRANAVQLFNKSEGQPLINPHTTLLKNNSQNGTVRIVDGLYSYYHYMQNGVDDNGWGCAYRSLQTIVSWYKLQGYTDIPIPTHEAIQKCLVQIGDKPSNFIGSKQWIGSTEVGYVLETLLGVEIKILRAATGEEMSSLASDIAHHFETQGTPIMIGGGVLAHTILGISYDESDVKYLILDPHYVGPDHLPTVINKGWCGWKRNNFWKKDSFYNMCLPQRPICI